MIESALKIERELTELVAKTQQKCIDEERKQAEQNEEMLKEVFKRSQKEFEKAIAEAELESKNKLVAHLAELEEGVNTFLAKHESEINDARQAVCSIVCTPSVREDNV